MSATALRVGAHTALFLVAIVVFYLGLGVGLQVSPAGGYVLWAAAFGLVLLNVLWIVRSMARAKR